MQVLAPLVILLFLSSCENRYRKGQSQNQGSPEDQKKLSGKISGGAYQVTRNEYDRNFETRYGLLYLSTSDIPLSGRILTIDSGENGDFVFSDENWKDGRKHGKSSKWFTNGVKMYERHYKEGKWHGTVTRWWPNGQKMYVRAYSNGVRHGKEATWRSDGTPLEVSPTKTPGNVNTITPPQEEFDATGSDNLPSIDLPGFEEESSSEPIMVAEPNPELLLPQTEDTLDGNNQDIGESGELPSLDEVGSELPVMDEPVFPAIEAADSDPLNDLLPETPELSDELSPNEPMEDDFSGLPELPSQDPAEGALPPLPGDPVPAVEEPSELPSSEPGLELPLLPGMEDEGGLPPLPDTDDGLGDLPPLPPLP